MEYSIDSLESNALKTDCFNPTHVAYHYASMFRKAMEARNEDGTIRIKKLCYALRASLCMKYAMDVEEMPPTPFADVLEHSELNPGEREAIRDVLEQKETALEHDVVQPDTRLVDLLADRYDSIASHPWCKNGTDAGVCAKLEHIFRDCVKGAV